MRIEAIASRVPGLVPTAVIGRESCRRVLLTAAAAAGLALAIGAAPAAAECPDENPTYMSPCGPTFVLPAWGDAGGWTKPEQYETIQLADVDGDGAKELLGRTPAGLAIHNFDTTLGQWRPQLDDKDRPIVLTAFADPPPLSPVNRPGANGPSWWNTGAYPPRTDWTLPQYYDTIQAADIDGDKRAEVIARSRDGLIAFKFTPIGDPKAGKGTWKQLPSSSQMRDSGGWGNGPFYYATIGTGDFDGNGDAELFARGSTGPVVLDWTGSAWDTVVNITEILSDADQGQNPAYYTSLQAAPVPGTGRDMLFARNANGIAAYQLTPGSSGWKATLRNPDLTDRAFGDIARRGVVANCPMRGDAGGHCLGSAPAYYGTLQFAAIGDGSYVSAIARGPAGLQSIGWGAQNVSAFYAPDMIILADLNDNFFLSQDKWETIQFADIDGDRGSELLARDRNGLGAWKFQQSRTWAKLTPSTALPLADDPWGTDRSYYSTIQAGDVDGDGREDVIARGPYGIRTWFYRNGGWASYKPSGYPAFDTDAKQKAFDKLNALAREHGYLTSAQNTVRDVWSRVNEPTADLTTLRSNLASLAGCPASSDALPQYKSCALPDGASGFTSADWTTVVNRIVAELYYATQVLDHFHSPVNGVSKIWNDMFVNQLAQLPAITQSLQLQAARDITATYDTKELIGGIMGIVGSVVSLVPGVGEIAHAPFAITSEVMAMIPSASEDLTGELDSTINELQREFASGISQASQAMADHSQIIRQDANLLTLVGQLRSSGTWQLDPTAMVSSAQQGFSLWLYKTLLPKMYVRYEVTNCYTRNAGDNCEQPNRSRARVPGAFGQDTPSFSMIGRAPTQGNWGPQPCWRPLATECKYQTYAISDELADKVWREMDPLCTYDGTTNAAAWTFGKCDVGVDPLKSIQRSSISSQFWHFPTYPVGFWYCLCGTKLPDPIIDARSTRAAPRRAAQLAGTVRGSARVVAGKGAALRLRGTIEVPRSFRLRGASVTMRRVLHESGGAGELARGRPGLPLALAPTATGDGARTFAGRRRAGRGVHLRLRRRSSRLLAFKLRTGRQRLSLPHDCSGTRRGVDVADAAFLLSTRLHIRDRRGRSHLVSLPTLWHCRTNRLGTVHKLVLQQPRPLTPSRGGLRVRVRGPRHPTAGAVATYRVIVRNRHRTPAYDVLIHAGLPRGFTGLRTRREGDVGMWRLARLRPGQTRVLRVKARVAPAAAGAKRRVVASAQAIDTRTAGGRFTTTVRSPRAPSPCRAAGARTAPDDAVAKRLPDGVRASASLC